MRTIDAGQTWQLQYEDKDSAVTRILFVNDQEGWLTGVKYAGSPLRAFHLLLHTMDRGQHWVDASGELNRVAAVVQQKHWVDASGDRNSVPKDDGDFVNDFITDIRSDGPLSATVLTGDGQIYKTDDGGQRWQIVMDNGPDYLSWSRYNRLGVQEDKHLWVALSADSSRGMFGRLEVQQGNSRKQYTLFYVYFSDVSYPSDNQVLASGYVPFGKRRPSDITQGVLLSSSDGGDNWTIIYRNTKIKKINALAASDVNNIWAVGEGGLILRLERSFANPTAASSAKLPKSAAVPRVP
jgi:photosystem II stability/assembly factor-like uncharacterized protein